MKGTSPWHRLTEIKLSRRTFIAPMWFSVGVFVVMGGKCGKRRKRVGCCCRCCSLVESKIVVFSLLVCNLLLRTCPFLPHFLLPTTRLQRTLLCFHLVIHCCVHDITSDVITLLLYRCDSTTIVQVTLLELSMKWRNSVQLDTLNLTFK